DPVVDGSETREPPIDLPDVDAGAIPVYAIHSDADCKGDDGPDDRDVHRYGHQLWIYSEQQFSLSRSAHQRKASWRRRVAHRAAKSGQFSESSAPGNDLARFANGSTGVA